MKLLENINKAILAENEKEQQERIKKKGGKNRTGIFASDVLGCQRKILLEMQGLIPKFDVQTLRIFDNGNSVHARIVKYLKNAGYELEEEITIPPANEFMLSGRLDGKIVEDGKEKLIEIKSIKNFYYLKESAKKEHICQLMIYMNQTGIKEGYIIYEAKDNQEIKIFPITFDEKLWEEISAWLNKTVAYIKKGKIPNIPFEYRKNKFPCAWCPHVNHCWGGKVE